MSARSPWRQRERHAKENPPVLYRSKWSGTTDYKSIAIWNAWGLGDNLLTLQLVRTIRAQFPQAEIHFFGNKDATRLFTLANLITHDHGYSQTGNPGWMWMDTGFNHTTNGLFPAVERAYHFEELGSPDAFVGFSNIGTVPQACEDLGIQNYAIGRICSYRLMHQFEYKLATARSIGIDGSFTPYPVELALPLLPLPSSVGYDLSTAIVIHHGSTWPNKNWPRQNVLKLAQTLRTLGYTPALLKGIADVEIPQWDGIDIRVNAIEDVVAVLQRCRAYIGNDSGITHLAGLLGTPTLALFGPTEPICWRPVGKQTSFIKKCPSTKKDDFDGIMVCTDRHCMNTISVSDVVQALEQFLESSQK